VHGVYDCALQSNQEVEEYLAELNADLRPVAAAAHEVLTNRVLGLRENYLYRV
jgi:hypothetical protein